MSKRLEDKWKNEASIESYNPFRELFREGSSDIVRQVFGQHIRGSDRIVEVGSGLGELVRLVSEYEGQIQQTEQAERITRRNKELNLKSNVVVANVHTLRQDLDSVSVSNPFEVAVGYSAFDTFDDLERAIRSLSDATVADGKIIHFLDMSASSNTFFHRYEPQGFVPFAFFEVDNSTGKTSCTGLQLVRKEDLPKVRAYFVAQKFGSQDYFDTYVTNPEHHFTQQLNEPTLINNLYYDSVYIKNSGVDVQVVRFNESFQNEFERALVNSGYQILESGKREGIATVQRNGRHSVYPQFNVFHSDVGLDKCRFDPSLVTELGSDKVKVIAEHYVVVAKKAQPHS